MHYWLQLCTDLCGCLEAQLQFGQLQNGKCITVQTTAADRWRKGAKRGKRPLIPGRPVGDITEIHSINGRNVPKGKRAHGLAKSITHGTQNAGKW